ncbi:hypothetical protein GWI33_019800 [Rhynchophorus ferrugineus]|uniref:Protein big brother n=1 Tax=Rhynchophorus ferrugineus TaxID=354439 RepID=A0A834M3X8_RHYFE|nr:hypothetical protein GWI33_019800 [Rhynchophorus ferrugineus]
MNGVCVRWRGWIDLERLDGVGCIEFDEEAALREDAILREQMERYTQRLREYEDNKSRYRLDRPEQDEVRLHAAGPSSASMSMPRPYIRVYSNSCV